MTIPRYRALCREWRRIPPLRWMIAAQIGFKVKPRDGDASEPAVESFDDFKRQCQGMGL